MVKAVESRETATETSLDRVQKEVEINQTKGVPIEGNHAEEITNPDKSANEIMFALKYDRSNPPDGHLPSQQPA